MVRLFFTAFWGLCLALSASCCLAYAPVQSPPISERQSLIDFVRDCVEDRLSEFIVNYTHGYIASNDDLLYSCNLPHVHSRVLNNNGRSAKVLYKISFYPGMKVADAYLNHNLSDLNSEELELYKIAVDIVNQARDLSALQAELFFHDTICTTVKYFTDIPAKTLPRYATAIGAFIDQKANCQGYCDAFYMLCTMFGLKVDMQSGIASKQKHVWNVIEIKGKWYAVDVTWDDNDTKKNNYTFISHKYFNAPKEIIQATHTWKEEDTTQEIQSHLDEAYFYCTDEVNDYDFGNYFKTTREAIDFITLGLIHGRKSLRIMVKDDDPRYEQIKFVNFQINRILSNARKSISFYTVLQKHGNYLYISVDVKRVGT
ncbi:MAG: hypothetical protein IJU40_05240 [Desulfovibrionaceae bacterium]|nr:hypothetical protein [Desulfovibrionaceae bacterium]